MTGEDKDAMRCGRFAREMAGDAFKYRDRTAYAHHDALIEAWHMYPGFWEGYNAGAGEEWLAQHRAA